MNVDQAPSFPSNEPLGGKTYGSGIVVASARLAKDMERAEELEKHLARRTLGCMAPANTLRHNGENSATAARARENA